MDVLVRKWMASAILTAAVLVGNAETLWAQAAPAAPAAPASGQAAAPAIVVYRKALMNSNTQHMAALRALTSGQVELRDHIRMHAAALYENAVLLTKGISGSWDVFPRGSTHPTSRATPKIWAEGEGGIGVEFQWRTHAFEETAGDLVRIAQSKTSTNEQIQAAVQRVQVTCAGCHNSMRGPAIATTN